MKQWNGTSAVALTALLLGSTATRADITANEVWQGMSDYYADLGQQVETGSMQTTGDTLVITDAVFASETPEGKFSATIPEIRLRELGDGRVEVTMSEEIPVQVLTKPETGETVDMGMKVTHSGLSMIVSGDMADTAYDITAPEMAFIIDGMKVDGADVPLQVNATLTGNTGSYRMLTGTSREVTSDMSADKVDFEVGATDPKGNGTFSASGSLTGLSGTSFAVIPEGVDMTDMNAALQAGMNMKGEFTYSGGGYVMDFQDKEESFSAQSTGEGGKLHFEMSKDGLSYGGEGQNSDISMQASAFPLPIDLSVAETAFNLSLPVSKGDEAQPFGLLLKFVDLGVSEGIWSMFDPSSQLPRDPATLIVDVTGAAKLLINIFDPAEAESIADQPPGELEKIDINQLQLSVAGAELSGKGAMTFDNSMGMPKPLGALDLQLIGGNTLIDKLVAMGFVPADQAAGAKMMMGLFAIPTGEDTLTSKIEFKEDGGIYANGQRIQ
ncbi:hypothetical protein DEA8626_02893 [Defluviimonas aquaemixtae]|uniref:DUF2125 domain-containing protein n=1 Tax=Albidovulum aquaemixtae TaxID=1542388 RepID=A0A2R8BK94_9RHOB|nr:DUF2125 domain-containing protein [Defluviimonas aquaemixtae]SPH23821.1 hypothetical protein DEA8626_02893 [Defluviimonas aquaemixtae]